MSFALNIENLNKTYGQFQALKDVNLSIKKSDFFALLGPNGAGKTTLIGILSSLVNKTSGKVQIFDKDIDIDFSGAKSFLGVVPQEFNFTIFETPQQILTYSAGYFGLTEKTAKKRIDKYLELLNLSDKKNVLSRNLSGGMKRRLIIARALIHEPEIIILDEPTAGVDVEIRRLTWDFLKHLNDEGKTIILTTHYLEEAENLCKNIAIIKQGEIIVNTSIKEILNRSTSQTFVLELEHEFQIEDIKVTKDMKLHKIDPFTLEIKVNKEKGLKSIFEIINTHQLHVINITNKGHKLEELFLELTRTAS